MNIFLCGDVMLGRGIDQALPKPCSPRLHEHYTDSALTYLRRAEETNGPIPVPVGFDYVWGAALEEFNRVQLDARIINLETSITHSDAYEAKGINYRMSPENAECLASAGIDCCTLANNHVLDWGRGGLLDTLTSLRKLGIKTAGAGRNLAQASAPAILELKNDRRLLVFSFACVTSGTPKSWRARTDVPGINLLHVLSEATIAMISKQVAFLRRPNDTLVVSLHWGPNWGHEISLEQRWFAQQLIDRIDVSVVHGHSSHHAKAMEIYRNRLILYGCGDFLNDYESIGGYEEYRGDLVLMYLPRIDPVTNDLLVLEMVPLKIQRFRLARPSGSDVAWLKCTLSERSRGFGTHVNHAPNGRLEAVWSKVT